MNQGKEGYSIKDSHLGKAISFLFAEIAAWSALFSDNKTDLNMLHLPAFFGGLILGIVAKHEIDKEKSWIKKFAMILVLAGTYVAADVYARLSENYVMAEGIEVFANKTFILGIITYMLLKFFASPKSTAQ